MQALSFLFGTEADELLQHYLKKPEAQSGAVRLDYARNRE